MRPPSPSQPPDPTEIVAGNILGAVVIFILLQVPVMILLAIFAILLPGLGVTTPAVGGELGIAVALVSEAALILYLVRMVRRGIRPEVDVYTLSAGAFPTGEDSQDFERRLERLMILGALLGIGCSLLMGLGSFGARVALTVIEAFAILFLMVVIATRWFLTRRVSAVALIALGVTVLSVGLATGLIRR